MNNNKIRNIENSNEKNSNHIKLSIFALLSGSCGQSNKQKQSNNNTNSNLTIMNKDTFWHIIETTKDINTEIMYLNLTKKMTELSKKDVQIFRTYLTVYMGLLDETIWVDMACKIINGYVSDDTALYFTLWLISRGETVLLNALYDPDTLSELPAIPWGNANFEMLMSIGFDENEDMNNKMQDKIIEEITSTIKFKEGKKFGKYKTFEEGMQDIPNVLPRLIKRAELEKFDWRNYI